MRNGRPWRKCGELATWPVMLVFGGLLACVATAQEAVFDRQAATMTVRVVDGPSGRPVTAERVLVREPGAVTTTVAEHVDVDGSVTFRDVMLLNFKPYIVTAWVQGVAYHAEQTGQAFLDGKELTVHAFPQTDDVSGLVITGLNVIVRERQNGLGVEWVLQLENRARPQRTVPAGALPVRLALPPGLQGVSVEVGRGPDPLTASVADAGDGLMGVAVDLPPGTARVTVSGFVTAPRVDLTMAFNLPVEAWSLLAWPALLEVRSFDLERDTSSSDPAFARWRGPTLAPGQRLTASVGLPASLATHLEPVDADEPMPATTTPPTGGPRFPVRTVVAAIVLLGLYAWWKWRRRR